jgi:predicted dehydrogenase
MSRAAIRIGVVGQGFIARAHTHALMQLRQLEAAARLEPIVLCGHDASRAQANARRWGYERATGDWREVVDANDVDLVCVLATNDLHHPIALAALDAGKAVLCEKPLGLTLDQSREMEQAAQRAGVLSACSFNYRFMPAIALAKRLIDRGELGSVSHYRARYLQDWGWDAAHDWHHDRDRAGSGAIGDYCHIVDLAHHLVGDIECVSAQTLTVRAQREDRTGTVRPVSVEDGFVAAGRFCEGALLCLEASRVATGRKAQQWIEINGEQGSLWWDMEDLNHLWLYRRTDGESAGFRRILVTEPQHPFLAHWWPSGHGLGWEHSLVHQWIGLAQALAQSAPTPAPQADFSDGVRADAVVDALLRAAANGRATSIEYKRESGYV